MLGLLEPNMNGTAGNATDFLQPAIMWIMNSESPDEKATDHKTKTPGPPSLHTKLPNIPALAVKNKPAAEDQVVTELNDILNNTSPDDNHDPCCVCLLHVQEPATLPCGHQFHLECIQKWAVEHDTCPTCRGEFASIVLTKENGDQQLFKKKEGIQTTAAWDGDFFAEGLMQAWQAIVPRHENFDPELHHSFDIDQEEVLLLASALYDCSAGNRQRLTILNMLEQFDDWNSSAEDHDDTIPWAWAQEIEVPIYIVT